ncbi:MAG: hypothetical protein IPK14_00855 [Blastocatellia bacterium]|nr:hypothetical protein [Blastocatellia bacterium]MBN8721457.1 hypothetical protein [Acidobacteriota bacterium]
MKKFFYLLTIIILLQFFPKLLIAQDQVQQSREFVKAALKLYQEKNYPAYLENMEKANKLRPNHPELTYNYAGALALTGKKELALKELNKFADFGVIANPLADEDFSSIKDSKEFQEIIKKIEKNSLPIGEVETIASLPEKDLITEGLAYDSQEEKFYAGSIRKRKIITIDKNGKVSDFTSSQQDGLWGVFGMQIDPKRRVLWVATSSLPEIADFRKEEDSQAAIFQYDLKTKKLLKKFSLSDNKKHIFGDLTLNSKGDVFITDSISPNIYYISATGHIIETLANGPFVSLQGISLSEDGNHLFVSDYSQGIFEVDLKNKNKITKLESPANATLLGIDGIYFYQNSLIAVQNGINPRRVIKLSLSNNFDKIENFTTLAANKNLMPDPTLATIINNNFYFFANAQWNNFDRSGNILPLEKFVEPTLVKIKLGNTTNKNSTTKASFKVVREKLKPLPPPMIMLNMAF